MTTIINADNGVISGVSGLKYSADNSGILVIQTNGTTALTINADQTVTFAGAVSFASSSFTNLSYSGTLTGGTGVIAIGTNQIYKDSSGNVGIGTSTVQGKLSIQGDVYTRGGGVYYVQNSDNTNNYYLQNLGATGSANASLAFIQGGVAERMRITSAGNVGIGTNNPSFNLEVFSNISATATTAEPSIHVKNSTSDVYLYNSYIGNSVGLYDGTSPGPLFTFDRGAQTWLFYTATQERLRINSAGYVLMSGYGVGTAPSAAFEAPMVSIGQTGLSSTSTRLRFAPATAGYNVMNIANTAGASGGGLVFSSGDAAANSGNTPYMIIRDNGLVGIGTSSPTDKLTVSGGGLVVTGPQSGATNGGAVNIGYSSNTGSIYSVNPGVAWKQLDIWSATTTFGVYGTECARFDTSGNLLVGTSNSFAASRTNLQGSVPGQLAFRNSAQGAGKYWFMGVESGNDVFVVYPTVAGGVYMTYGATSWTGNSDERLKTDLKPIKDAVNKVNQLRSVTGRFKTDEKGKSRSFLIAQDVQKVLPEAVHEKDDEIGTLGVAYTDVIPLLVAAIKELNAKVETLESQLAAK